MWVVSNTELCPGDSVNTQFPPTSFPASKMVMRWPSSSRFLAAVMPDGPAPMMQTDFCWVSIGLKSGKLAINPDL